MLNSRKIIKKIIPTELFSKVEPYGHLIEAIIANIYYGFPSRKMHVIGITGTNGKTTTTFLINKMLHISGYKVGMLSTVAYGALDNLKPQIEHMTTSSPFILQKRIRDFKRAGVEWLVLETSSHSLAQNRVWGIPYEIAVMTNVTGDHLDYHKTFDNYLLAKLKLFKLANKHGKRFGVVNADDENAKKFINEIDRSVTYGLKLANLKAEDIKLLADHSTYEVNDGKDNYKIRINIPGEFNVSNSLAAVAVGREIGLSPIQIEKGIEALDGVEGRMTVINVGQKYKVIVDFASTPDAFVKLFESVRPATKGRLISVFGSAGRRDEAKRFTQGYIAGKNSDVVILTEEDDRDVNGIDILNQIAKGSKKAGKVEGKDLFLIHDREEAINFAITQADNSNDTIVLLGKGHEKTIERNSGTFPWNEIKVAKSAIKNDLVNQ